MRPVTIVSLNTYLIAKEFNRGRLTQPDARATRIRSFAKGKGANLAFFQEVWGSGLRNLVQDDDHASFDSSDHYGNLGVPPKRLPLLSISGKVVELLNSLYILFLETGGLYDMHNVDKVSCLYRSKHTFTVSRSGSKKGVEATLWKLDDWDGKGLLVFNTHLDPWHPANRKEQISQISAFMLKELAHLKAVGQDLTNTGVMIVGDFNIKAGSDEYRELLSSQPPWCDLMIDDAQDEHRDHTYSIENPLVTHPEDCGRIDYAFTINRFGMYTFLPLDCVSARVERQEKNCELSDHFPLVFQLIPGVAQHGEQE